MPEVERMGKCKRAWWEGKYSKSSDETPGFKRLNQEWKSRDFEVNECVRLAYSTVPKRTVTRLMIMSSETLASDAGSGNQSEVT
ncbi:hypothetical protein CEXT_383581 [Caerostris extrusa]|uniref:Uncharacterized protein n=1 Tax=Caerostris extrusa TaxID=172846 RepID=A0AAV4MSW4_CAEEX|nr:hypothetical protein CEXT_383581 [Caerostris extrusa]